MDRWKPALIGAVALLSTCAIQALGSDAASRLNADGVTRLLDVMDALAAVQSRVAERDAEHAGLDETEREAALDAARQKNEKSPAVRAAIDSLLASQTYRVYFRRFPNITAAEYEDLLLDLPYRERRAPGDIGKTLFELFRMRDTIRSGLDRLLQEADMEWVYDTAQRFAPGWDGALPTMHLVYDSNAGSFAAEGIPFLNVYTAIDLRALAEGDATSLQKAEATMAHELQHVLAEPTLYPEPDPERTWQERWLDDLTRGTVGEGIANLTSPPRGRLQAAYEDPNVLAALAERFNKLLRLLAAGEMTEEEMQAWYRDNYFDVAIDLLRGHLAKTYSGDELEVQLKANMRHRPDFEHAFGWWMISRIWENNPRPETVRSLLDDPFSAYARYNETLDDDQRHLRIDWPTGQ